MVVSSYNTILALLSFVVAGLASYTALIMVGRVAVARGIAAYGWLIGSAFAIGFGFWSMNFLGILAFTLSLPPAYDIPLGFLSLLIGIAASAIALWLGCTRELSLKSLALGALTLGLGFAGMHYTGMAAMRLMISHMPSFIVLSIAPPVLASSAGIWIAFRLRDRHSWRNGLWRIGAAMLLGGAIAGTQFICVAALASPQSMPRPRLDAGWLALLIITITLAILVIALLVSILDFRMQTRVAALAASLAKANQELTQLTLHDTLTKLPNRLLLEDRLAQMQEKARRDQGHFAVMAMDLDGFKTVNDAYGRDVGDLLLVDLAQRLRSVMRAQDTIARMGGNEFIVLTEVRVPNDAATIAEKLVAMAREPTEIEGHDLRISISIGIAIYPGDGETQRDLIAHADAAMYHAKEAGRNGYCFFEASMNANMHEQLELLHDLRLAVERGELALHYQPKFIAPNGPVTGAEALLRWYHPKHGLIQPDQFIPLAEKSGLIVPIGEWVLDEACRQMELWHAGGHEDWTIAVNLSSLQFGHAGLIDTVRDTLERHHLKPGSLTLEVTETTAMRDAETSVVILRSLSEMGVHISIDDFGTGYSSLLYLKRLSASELKIDRGFVRDLAEGTDDAAIVSSIVALGQTLNMKIVAEGVETPAQQDFLTLIGCDVLQGYLLGRPIPADAFLAQAADINRQCFA